VNNKKIIIGIPHGDINGISYEIIINTFNDNRMFELCTPVVYGSPKVAAYYKKALNINTTVLNTIQNIGDAQPSKINILNCIDDSVKVEMGQATQLSAEASVIALDKAADDLKDGKIDAIVPAPLSYENVGKEPYNFKSYISFFKDKLGNNNMLSLISDESIKVGILSDNVVLSDVGKYITEKNILDKLGLLKKVLISDFCIDNPKIAVFSLNPKSVGDSTEDNEIITPVIKKAFDSGISAFGPFAAANFYSSGDFRSFDAVLAMYYDQGVAPVNALNMTEGVYCIAGLDAAIAIPEITPEFDKAGQGIALVDGLRNAIYTACDIYKSKELNKEISKNPLKTYDISDK